MDAMTQYGAEEPEKLVESEEQEQRDNLELQVSGDHKLREDDLDEAEETAETKGELSREDVYDISG